MAYMSRRGVCYGGCDGVSAAKVIVGISPRVGGSGVSGPDLDTLGPFRLPRGFGLLSGISSMFLRPVVRRVERVSGPGMIVTRCDKNLFNVKFFLYI